MAVLMAVISNVDLSPAMEKGIIFAASIALISITPFVWKKLGRFSSRVFFSGLYDYTQLKEAAEESIYSSSDPFKSIPSTLRELVFPLGLERLGVLILPQVIGEQGILFECWRSEDDSLQLRCDPRAEQQNAERGEAQERGEPVTDGGCRSRRGHER